MHRKLYPLLGLGAALALAVPATASADTTLGTTTQPTGSTTEGCTGALGAQIGSDAGTPYAVPAPGKITQWQTNTNTDTAGAPLSLLVLRPIGGSSYTVVGVDSESVPNPLPAGGVATFTILTPLAVDPGDVLGLYSMSGVNCAWSGTGVPADDVLGAALAASVPAAGSTVTMAASLPNWLVDLAATFAPANEDAAVTTSTSPTNAAAGLPAVLSSTVTNNGPASAPITFTDHVPSALTIDSAVAGNGSCATSGQTVTCTVSGLSAGQSAPVNVVVTPSAAGSYANSVSVSPVGAIDNNAANDSASATLAVGPAALPAKCVVPSLRDAPSRVARTVLGDLGCQVKTAQAHSKHVREGLVIQTKPGPGTYAHQATITLLISSGPKRSHHK
jgi:hypothetical protein